MDGDSGTGGLADGVGGFADDADGFADGAGLLEHIAATAAAAASAAQPRSPSLSLNHAATMLRLSWRARRDRPVKPRHQPVRTPPFVWDFLPVLGGHDGRRSGGGRAVCRRPRSTICVLFPRRDCWRRTFAGAVWLWWRRRR